MANGMYTAVSGAIAREQRLHQVANDLANLGTVGYRRHSSSFKEHVSSLQHDIVEQAPLDMTLRSMPNDVALVSLDAVTMREEQGALDQTGGQLDLALRGKKAYFVVQDAEGREQLTRDGRFQLNAERQITTLDGLFLLGDGGPMTVPPDVTQLQVSLQGEVRAQDALIGSLRLEYSAPDTLKHLGGNRFEAQDTVAAEDVEVAQGYLEQSTVNAVGAMVDMIALQRGFEANVKSIQQYKQIDTDVVGLLRRF